MFYHGYNGYLTHASAYDELKPISCSGIDTWSSSSLTLIDALDTLVVMGNYSEFQRVVDHIITKVNFDKDINVSVFETNIRIVGGLLSAHLLSHKAGFKLEVGYPCNGPLLRLAEKVARKLLPAFDTKTGMPYGTVNLKYGVPQGETSVTCTAGIGTFIVEFGALSRLTGDPIFEEVAIHALYALYNHRSPIGLMGNHIDVQSGIWTAQDSGIGAGVDSYYEYLVKGAIMLNRPELLHMFNEGRAAIDKYLKKDDWHVWVSMNKGQMTLPVFQSLQAFWPGLLSLLGDINTAMKSLHNMHSIWKQYGFLPEFYNIPNSEAGNNNRDSYPLRPELIESVMYLYRATGDPYLLEVGEDILKSIQYSAKTPCGYATIKNVKDHRKQDSMESFFLAETTKYLYLLFDPDNFLNSDGGYGTLWDTPNGECIIESSYIYNTEAHPIDVGALRCCYDVPRESIVKGFNRQKFLGEIIEMNEKNIPDQTEIKIEEEEEDPIKDTQEFKKELLDEIMSALSNAKKKIEENMELKKRFIDITSREKDAGGFDSEKNVVDLGKVAKKSADDDISEETENSIQEIFELDDPKKPPIKIVKLSPSALESDLVSTQPSKANNNDDVDSTGSSTDGKTHTTKVFSSKPTNNSILTDFVQAILKTSSSNQKPFDEQLLLQKIRSEGAKGHPQNESWSSRYDLLTCKAQPYLQRVSIMGEFY